jgi:putative transcriptional regulator
MNSVINDPMPIQSKLEIVMAARRISLNELSGKVNITQANLSNLKRGKARAIRFTTLEALCETLCCQPADLLEYSPGKIISAQQPIDLIGMLKCKAR